MAIPVAANTKYAVFVAGTQIRTFGDVAINESLDNLCRVAEFDLGEQPTDEPEEGDTVLIQWLDYDAALVYDVFGGIVNAKEIESEPWNYIIRCTDQLALLRRARTADFDLTGMTEGAVIKNALDFCGITYDPGDIVDSGYVLGAETAVKWLADTTAAQIVGDINSVFGCVLMTVGNNRVVRFRPDIPPVDDTGKYRNFVKGTDADWDAHRRVHGDRDQIQNLWDVRGASVPCGTDAACQCQPWGHAVASNPQLGGRRIRVPTQSVSSDLIQDESLAEYIVRRQMRLTNRFPDEAVLEAVNDVNMHPGTKIGLIDPTYGIDAVTARLCCVTGVDRTGPGMTLNCVCGAPGSEGTVTTGVEKVCNSTHSPLDWPGSFTPPDFGYPSFDGGGFGAPGFDPGIAFDPLDFFHFLPPIFAVGGTCPAPATPDACDTAAFADAVAIEAGRDWQITGTVTLTLASQALNIGVSSDSGDYLLTIAGGTYYSGLLLPPMLWEVNVPGQFRHIAGSNVLNQPIDYILQWREALHCLIVHIVINGNICYVDAIIMEGSPFVGAESQLILTGSPTEVSETLSHNCGAGGGGGGGGVGCADLLVTGDNWTEDIATLSVPGGSLSLTGQAGGFSDQKVVLASDDWVLFGRFSWDVIGSAHDIQFGVGPSTASPQYFVNLLSGADGLYLTGPSDYVFLADATFSDGVPIDVTLKWIAATTTLSVIVTDGTNTSVASLVDATSPTGTLNTTILESGPAGPDGLTFTEMQMCIGVALGTGWSDRTGFAAFTEETDTDVNTQDDADHEAYRSGGTDLPIDGSVSSVHWTGHSRIAAIGGGPDVTDVFCSIMLQTPPPYTDSWFTGLQIEVGNPGGLPTNPVLFFSTNTDFTEIDNTSLDIYGSGFDFDIFWDKGANQTTFILTDGTHTITQVLTGAADGPTSVTPTLSISKTGDYAEWYLTEMAMVVS